MKAYICAHCSAFSLTDLAPLPCCGVAPQPLAEVLAELVVTKTEVATLRARVEKIDASLGRIARVTGPMRVAK